MALHPTSVSRSLNKRKKENGLKLFYKKYINFEYAKFLIFDPGALPIVSWLILIGEFLINIFVIQRVSYTEIDWKAYMQECEGFLNGTTNYSLLKGDTGPLVYPASFIYIYSALYYITSHGENIRLAQYIFAGVYLLQMWLVLRLYTKSRKVPPYVLVISAFTSYRIHSIYILRLFNDPIAILFLYVALNLFLDGCWTLGSISFSFAVGVKMNILLFAPALLLFYLTNLGYWKTVIQLTICGILQLILGSPFLLTYPWEYLKGSFNLGRIFEHKWTVNYRFLSRAIFEDKYFHLSLLVLHVVLLIVFAKYTYGFFKSYTRLREVQKQIQPQITAKNIELKNKALNTKKQQNKSPLKREEDEKELTPAQQSFLKSFEHSLQKSTGLQKPLNNANIITTQKDSEEDKPVSIHFDQATQLALMPLFLCNFIGLVCSRSLHYQFYVWYYHSLPYLTWSTNYSLVFRFLILGFIEFCWNTYPSTKFSSIVLHICHILLLFGIGRNMYKTMGQSALIKEKQNDQQMLKTTKIN